MADMLKIVNGISQAVANSHDGAIDENGDPVLIGLKREEGVPITDKRVMDGFNVSFYGDQLCVHYHSEVFLKEVHDKKFESNVEQMIENIVSFIKKGPKILMVQPNYKFRAISENQDEKKSVEDAFARSVVWGFDIVARNKNTYVIDATP